MNQAIEKRSQMRILFVALVFILSLVQCSGKTKTPGQNEYTSEWKKIDSLLTKESLPKSAQTLIEKIQKEAANSSNDVQTVKALMYRLKVALMVEEDALVTIQKQLQVALKQVSFPESALMHSMMAELYWSYYQRHRWKIRQRTKVKDFVHGDMQTWSLKDFVEQVHIHYSQSLKDIRKLQQIGMDDYGPLLTPGNASEKLRPTLFDFIAHRAADFYMNSEAGITRPVGQFSLHHKKYLSHYKEFTRINMETTDTLSFENNALKILQKLLQFHKKANNIQALVDADLKRLKFVQENIKLDGKDGLYEKSLQNLYRKFRNDESSGEVQYAMARLYYEQSGEYESGAKDKNKWKRKQARELCEKVIERNSESYGASLCRELIFDIKTKSVNIKTEMIVPPERAFAGLFKYKNIQSAWLRVVPVKMEERDRLDRASSPERKKILTGLAQRKPVQKFRVNLPDDGDHHWHSLEFKVDGLAQGMYAILASTVNEFNHSKSELFYSVVYASSISYMQNKPGMYKLDLLVTDRITGQPKKNVKVTPWIIKYNHSSRKNEKTRTRTYTGNSQGLVSLKFSDDTKNYYRDMRLEITAGSERLFTHERFRYRRSEHKFKSRVRTEFFTDRSIYRPGQTVYYKGIMYQINEGKPEKNQALKNKKTTVTLKDVNRQKIASRHHKTNRYGTFSGEFVLPTGTLNGNFRISSKHGTVYIQVEEYKRPKFEVKINKSDRTYQLGKQVTVSGKATALAGYNISGAVVKYRVLRQAVYPHWGWWRGSPPHTSSRQITSGATVTDHKGAFKISFTAIPDPGIAETDQPAFNFITYVDITDLNGETRSTQKRIILGSRSLKVSLPIPLTLSKDSGFTCDILASNLSGEKVEAKGTIKIHHLKDPGRTFNVRHWDQPEAHTMDKTEYQKVFPHGIYADEDDISKWKRDKKVYQGKFNTGILQQLKIQDIAHWPPGKYVAEIKSKDRFGNEVEDFTWFTLYSTRSEKTPFKTRSWFTHLKESVQPGDTAKFLIGTSEENVYVLYEIEHRRKTTRKFLTLNKELREIALPIKEKHRGGIQVGFYFIRENSHYSHTHTIKVPWSNKNLDISFETFRNKLLPGEKEEWRLKIAGPDRDKFGAEMVAGLYDASLDYFKPHNWSLDIFSRFPREFSWDAHENFKVKRFSSEGRINSSKTSWSRRTYDELNWYEFSWYKSRRYRKSKSSSMNADREQFQGMRMEAGPRVSKKAEAKKPGPQNLKVERSMAEPPGIYGSQGGSGPARAEKKPEEIDLKDVKARRNLKETAFFYPHLKTDKEGNIIIAFTVPEALTKWKMLGLAHTPDLKTGVITNELITQKELMVVPNAPRFLRENDQIIFTSKITNLTDSLMQGQAQLMLFDALTMEPVDKKFNIKKGAAAFKVKKGASTSLSFKLSIPVDLQAVTYRVVARAGEFSDGEENVLPILKNRMLVTESMPLPVRSQQTKKFTFEKLLQSQKSRTLKHHKLTLEFTSNPAWYAVQALPYMMEYPYDCLEQIFSRYYANSIAAHIVQTKPAVKKVFEAWKNTQGSAALLSNLEKNQDLKSLLLQETPWVLDSQDEGERKKRIALLFDLGKMSGERNTAFRKLEKGQSKDGSWPWFNGMRPNRYVTQHIVTGLAHLRALKVLDKEDDKKVMRMVRKAMGYLDAMIVEDYDHLIRHNMDLDKNNLGRIQIHYLYARSYFKSLEQDKKTGKVVKFYLEQAEKYWMKSGRYLQGMIALTHHRMSNFTLAKKITASLKEHALHSEEMGMYWKSNYGYNWYQAPIETQALMIEVFSEVTGDDKSVDGLKTWLLKSKQTRDWKTTKATADACYALLLQGNDWLEQNKLAQITVGDITLDPKSMKDVKVEAGTGYFKTQWTGSEIKPEMGRVKVVNKNKVVSWGALYWQYFEQLDKITPHETPLKLKKQLFLEQPSATGPVLKPIKGNKKLKVGDRVMVRIELRVDRDMEFVHMKDMRAAGFEPENVLSRYKWQDGLGYYESTRDASTNFFMDHLPKGTYVFEYPLRISHSGDFMGGITSIQCMYAPEYASHSAGVRVRVGAK